MTIAPGVRLGPYEILAPLGAGGMGEVWRARDTRLGREVAVKVLPEAFAQDPERLARFEREAKAVAALSHPNILAIHDFGTSEGTAYAVTELLEGETLRDRLAQGALPVRRAIEVAVQVAHGLAAAHDKGIVHRDLKPENLWVGNDGRVKILDFGLAKQGVAEGPSNSSLAPTEVLATGAGMVLGTVGYMSPEQVRGVALDHRTDLFSFGAVLYELLSGKRAFQGETPADTMSAILKEEPPELAQAVRDLPAGLERIVTRCLEKQPAARFQSAHDLAFALETLSTHSSAAVPALAGPAGRRGGRRAVLAASGLALAGLALAAGWFLAGRMAPRRQPEFRQLTFQRGYIHSARFGSDHQTIIYGGAFAGRPVELFSTRTDATQSRALDLPSADVVGIAKNGEMAILLGRHHQGSWMRLGTLAQVPLSGGSPRAVLDSVFDADIAPDGASLAVVRASGAGQQLEFPIGHPVFKTPGWIALPRIAADGRRIAFVVHPFMGDDIGYVAVADAGGQVRRLSEDHNFLQGMAWAGRGDEIWATSGEDRGGTLWSAAPGRKERVVLRTPAPMRIHDVSPAGAVLITSDALRADISGRLAGDEHDRIWSWWSDDMIGGLAADGSAFTGSGPLPGQTDDNISYLRRNDGRAPVLLGTGGPLAMSPDGGFVVSATFGHDRDKLRVMPAGLGQPRVVELGGIECRSTGNLPNAGVSADGRRIAFVGTEGGRGPRAYVLDLPGGRPRAVTPEGVASVLMAPGGDAVSVLDVSGRVFVQPLAGGAAWTVPGVLVGEIPIGWTSDGHGLLVWDRTFPARVFRITLPGGARSLFREITPDDPAGILYGSLVVSPDGRYYLYRARRFLSDLDVVTGLR
jgi:hypothetical protein